MRVVPMALLAGVLAATPLSAQQNASANGKAVYDLVCAMCHSVAPPAKLAPPISHVVGFYLQKYKTADAAAAAIATWAKSPQAEKSLLPPMAIKRFGVMPPQAQLTDAQLRDVARYVVTLVDTAHMREMQGMKGGMQHDMPGMKHDSSMKHDMPGMKHDSTMKHDTMSVRRRLQR